MEGGPGCGLVAEISRRCVGNDCKTGLRRERDDAEMGALGFLYAEFIPGYT